MTGVTRRWIAAVAIAAFAIGVSVIVFRPSPHRPRDTRKPNIVLIVVDTLRADVVGFGRDERSFTPSIDAIAADGISFTQAVAQAPWTIPSISSLLTSRYPSEHAQGARTQQPEDPPATLADVLRSAAYSTAAFTEVTWPFLRRGFETFEMPVGDLQTRLAHPDRNGAELTFSRAIEWMTTQRSAPFFLFIHTYELHDYFMAKPYQRAAALEHHPDYRGPFRDWAVREPTGIAQRIASELLRSSEDDIAFVRGLYLGALEAVDRQIGRLDTALAELGLTRDTILVVTSDHGEGFRPSMKRVVHGGRLHEDLLHVPLIVRWPGRLRPQPVSHRVESIDLFPTLLDLAGVPYRPLLRGHTLVEERDDFFARLRNTRLFRPASHPRPMALSEESVFLLSDSGLVTDKSVHQYAIYASRRKLIHSELGTELFDLTSDPGEEHDLSERNPQATTAMRDLLRDQLAGIGLAEPAARHDVHDLLRALGYIL